MKTEFLPFLACPKTGENLIVKHIEDGSENKIKKGTLASEMSGHEYPIINGIPRFVPIENYSSSFGLEWNIHYQTQYDSYTGLPLSETRFFQETKWNRNLIGEAILEVGSGSGRFTTHAASTGATVISLDYSSAVESNYKSNGLKPNVLIVQGDMFNMPFKPASFDKLFCIGVLQHTPDPHRAFKGLGKFLKNGGKITIDIYLLHIKNFLGIKYYIRPITSRIKPQTLYKMVKHYVDFIWPLANLIRKIPKIGPTINWALGVADYSRLGLRGKVLKEWAYLDTFDMWSPRYDRPATVNTVRKWFEEAGYMDIEVHHGYNGVEGRGAKTSERN